jgi:predicted GNAT family N-acyltransferase
MLVVDPTGPDKDEEKREVDVSAEAHRQRTKARLALLKADQASSFNAGVAANLRYQERKALEADPDRQSAIGTAERIDNMLAWPPKAVAVGQVAAALPKETPPRLPPAAEAASKPLSPPTSAPRGPISSDTLVASDKSTRPRSNNDLSVEVVRDLNDFMKVVAIRSSVFLAEQDAPYDEEFDNNDLSATHLIAYVRGQPVATLRVRWFAAFAKIERVCVMKHVRGGSVVKLMIETAVDLIQRKGYTEIIGYIQKRLVPFWRQLGFVPREGRDSFRFADYDYVECIRRLNPAADALSVDSDPYVLMRPEGAWGGDQMLDSRVVRTRVS